MYEKHWGLMSPPFQNVPDPNFFFPSTKHREGLARLMYAVKHGKGAALLIGEVGSGKTTLSRAFILQLSEDKYDVGLVTNPSLPPGDLLEEIDLQLGISPPTTDKADLLRSLNHRLLNNVQEGKDTVLIIDEAHIIKDPEVYEELRMLLNFQLNDRFLLTLVLMGQPELKERIAAARQLQQRIAIRYHLTPLDMAETTQYILFRLQKAGCTRPLFDDEALRLLYQESRGLPRVINNLCDLCLLEGYASKSRSVDAALVRRVIATLA